MAGLESIQNKYLDGRNVSNCSEETKTDIDKEVVRVLKECHEKAFNILKENRDALDEIAEFLINKETITGDQFMEIFNRVKAAEKILTVMQKKVPQLMKKMIKKNNGTFKSALLKGLGELRKENGITQAGLAERMNVSRTCIANWESGKRIPKWRR